MGFRKVEFLVPFQISGYAILHSCMSKRQHPEQVRGEEKYWLPWTQWSSRTSSPGLPPARHLASGLLSQVHLIPGYELLAS